MKLSEHDLREKKRAVQGVVEAARALTKSFLGGERNALRLDKMFRKIRSYATGLVRGFDESIPLMPLKQQAPMTKACRAGCAYCCHQVVGASIPEVLWLGEYVRTHWTEEQKQRLRERIALYRKERIPFQDKESFRNRMPCPFLIDNCCSIYEVRPLVCQQFHSVDLQACLKFYNEPSDSPNIPCRPGENMLLELLMLGVRKEMHDAGMDISLVELGLAIETVLDHPEALDQYFAGKEDLFANVKTVVPPME